MLMLMLMPMLRARTEGLWRYRCVGVNDSIRLASVVHFPTSFPLLLFLRCVFPEATNTPHRVDLL
jgi:hypothetical protein